MSDRAKRELVLRGYLRGELTRDQAIEGVGINLVELAESQYQAVVEDLEWALQSLEER